MANVAYTEEQTTTVVDTYVAAEDKNAAVAQLATTLGKTIQSIRAKLTREGVYIAKTAAAAKEKTESKADLISAIAERLEVPVENLDSLDKANRLALVSIMRALTELLGEQPAA